MSLCPENLWSIEYNQTNRKYSVCQVLVLLLMIGQSIFIISMAKEQHTYKSQFTAAVDICDTHRLQEKFNLYYIYDALFVELYIPTVIYFIVNLVFFTLFQIDKKYHNQIEIKRIAQEQNNTQNCFKIRLGLRITLECFIGVMMCLSFIKVIDIENYQFFCTAFKTYRKDFYEVIYYPAIVNITILGLIIVLDNTTYFIQAWLCNNVMWGNDLAVSTVTPEDKLNSQLTFGVRNQTSPSEHCASFEIENATPDFKT